MEENNRLAFEKSERKRIKLEMKIRRRENRRLFNLEKQFYDTYAATADIERDIINIADIQGTDNNGMKTMGLRGGLLGEIFLQMTAMMKLPAFAKIKIDWLETSYVQNFWNLVIGEGWTVMIGVDSEFETNITPVLEGVNRSEERRVGKEC